MNSTADKLMGSMSHRYAKNMIEKQKRFNKIEVEIAKFIIVCWPCSTPLLLAILRFLNKTVGSPRLAYPSISSKSNQSAYVAKSVAPSSLATTMLAANPNNLPVIDNRKGNLAFDVKRRLVFKDFGYEVHQQESDQFHHQYLQTVL